MIFIQLGILSNKIPNIICPNGVTIIKQVLIVAITLPINFKGISICNIVVKAIFPMDVINPTKNIIIIKLMYGLRM